MRLLRRFRMRAGLPAFMVACIALFAALGGGAYAATQIITSSSQIKDGVITGADIKNGGITSTDLSTSTRDALKGQTGRPGRRATPA